MEVLVCLCRSLSVFSQNTYMITRPQAKRKCVCLKAPGFTTQLGPAQLFQVKALFSSRLLHAQEHMGAGLFFF